MAEMKTEINWQGDVVFEGVPDSGHKITIDGPPEFGGQDKGVRPMELLLLGLGGCTSFDMVHILKKTRVDLKSCRTQITAERTDHPPKVFSKIHIHYIVEGQGIKESAVQRAINLSAKKLCSAQIMLGKTAEITHSFDIIES